MNLSRPVGSLMRPTAPVESFSSIGQAVRRLRENGIQRLAVVDDGKLVGEISEQALAESLADARSEQDPCSSITSPLITTIKTYESGAAALRAFESVDLLWVTDDTGRLLGVLTPVDLWAFRPSTLRPPMVGGMATPLGVYLTTGSVTGGVSKWALVLTGSAMFAMLLAATLVADQLSLSLGRAHVPPGFALVVANALPLALFLGLMRIVPLSGTHGAEHMVVNAIERDEELSPNIIRRMPRVHPRCGTNIAAAASVFLGLFSWRWISQDDVRLLVALLVTVSIWRPLGSALQQFVTTKPPSDGQLNQSIRAAEELLHRYATAKVVQANPFMRIWNSGLLQVMTGATATAALLAALSKVFHWNLPLM